VCGLRTRAAERGSALVETALVAPLFLLLVFGVLEVGYAWLGRSTVSNMSVTGARAGSGAADAVLADHSVLRTVQGGAASLGAARITMVVVYRATGPDDRVPPACRTASVTDSATTRGCNRYVAADLTRPASDFGCVAPPGPAPKPDRFWCPTTRRTALQGVNGPPDYLGVYVEAAHDQLVGLGWPAFTFTQDTVMRIEPRTLS
jgi:hypothetical protein